MSGRKQQFFDSEMAKGIVIDKTLRGKKISKLLNLTTVNLKFIVTTHNYCPKEGNIRNCNKIVIFS